MAAGGTGYSCPACKRETGETNEILGGNQKLVCSKVSTHVWNDLEEFYALKPMMEFKQEQARPAPQEGHTSVNVSIPVRVYNILLQKYGDRMAATMTGAMNVLSEGESMVISGTDRERLKMIFGEEPRNSSHLFGMIYALQTQAVEAKSLAETNGRELKAYEGMSPGKLLLDIGEHFGYVKEQAASENMPMKIWLEKRLQEALGNHWF